MLRVLVIGPDDVLEDSLRRELPAGQFDVVGSRPGAAFLRAVRLGRPQIAVLDRVDGRRDAAQMEIALLRDLRHDVRIIVVSGASSSEDARLVEEGIFYYLSPPSIERLAAVIRAAGQSVRGEGDGEAHPGPADGGFSQAGGGKPPAEEGAEETAAEAPAALARG